VPAQPLMKPKNVASRSKSFPSASQPKPVARRKPKRRRIADGDDENADSDPDFELPTLKQKKPPPAENRRVEKSAEAEKPKSLTQALQPKVSIKEEVDEEMVG
jgi:hypothetical protein